MSYTAPQYVDTKEQAVLALASTIKGEAVTGGDGSVNRALDILADVLAEQDVQVPQTDAGAILALAGYVSGGGGGGTSTTDVYLWNMNEDEYADRLPSMVAYISGYEGNMPAYTQLQFEPITAEDELGTLYGVKVKDCPAGALFNGLSFDFDSGISFGSVSFGYSESNIGLFMGGSMAACPMPLDGRYVVGNYTVSRLDG